MADPTPSTAPPAPTPAPPDAIRRIFTATAVIGPSGQGKTSLAATFAAYLWEQYRKVLLFYSCDGGAFPTVIQKRIRQGLIRPWRMRTRSSEGLAFETCHLASKGYWPKTINPETGETDPAVQLVAPVTASYAVYCSKGHHLRTVPSPTLIVPLFCGECKEMVQQSHMRIVDSVKQTRGFEQVGGVFFDGLTSMCGWFMGELDTSRGAGAIGGEKPPLGGPVLSGSIKFGGNNRADYGFAQTRAYQIVHNSLSIPNLYEGPVFTALPDEVTEAGSLLPMVGIKLAGSALTTESLQWFGNVVEARIEKNEKDWDIRRLYLSQYVDKQNRDHRLKNSGPGTLPLYLEDPPINPQAPDARQFFTGFNLGNFFKLLDQALRESLAAPDTLGELPGMASAPGAYGEAVTVEKGAGEPPKATAPTSGIAPLTPSVAALPTTSGAAPTPSAAPPVQASGPPVVTARPRARKAPITMPPPAAAGSPAQAPLPPLAPAPIPQAPTPAPVSPAAPAVVPVGSTPSAPAAAAVPAVTGAPPVSGTTPPPPPGMRPPQRAPGS